jgi:dehydrogenase/reductase SDR family member 7B
MKIQESVVWITGASSGIGEALAYEANRKKAKVILSARRAEELNRVKNNCLYPDSVKILTVDLEKTDDLADKVQQAISLFGRVDILVNNGGLSQRSLARDTQLSVDERLMRINYLGTVGLTKSLLPHLLAKQAGQIVTVSSMVGKFGTPLRSSYAATKHALHGFMDSLRAEEAKSGLIVTMVCPGFVATNVSLNALTADGTAKNTMDKQTAAGIKPSDFARQMISAIEANKSEVYIAGGKEKFGLFLSRFCPKLFNKLVQKMAVT